MSSMAPARFVSVMTLILLCLLTTVARSRADGTPAASPAVGAPAEPGAGGAQGPLALGSTSPTRDVPMRSVDGRRVTLEQVAGRKGTLVIFMCNHCPWVRAWQTRIASIGNAAVAAGIGVVAINPNDPAAYPEDGFEQMVEQSRRLDLRFPYAVDSLSDVARAYGASRTPEAFLFDAGGRLVYHGAVDDNARQEKAVRKTWLRDAVEAVAKGRAVSIGETKALGCGIKYRVAMAG